MMKLKPTDEEEPKTSLGAIIFSVLFYTLSLGLIILIAIDFNLFSSVSVFKDNNKELICEATIEDIYISDEFDTNRYFILLNTEANGKYEVEINKGDFMTYKIGEDIPIKIKHGRAYILKE